MLLSLRHLLSLWKLAHRRLLAERALALALLAGWLAAVALIAAIPMYTDAINQALLRRELRAEQNSRRPSFAFLFHYTAGALAQARWDNYLALNQYLETRLADELDLPLQTRMHYVRSDLFQLYPAVGGHYNLSDDPLTRVDLGFIAESEPHLELVEGQAPSPTWEPGQPLEVLLSQQLAADLGLQVGEEYAIFDPGSSDRAAFTAFIRVAGIWRARDAGDPFWYIPPEAFDRTLLVSSGTYIGLLGNQIPRPLFDIGWYHVFDGGAVRAEDVAAFLQRVAAVETHIASLLPGAQLALSPTAALKRYQEAVSAQSVLILLLGLPMIGLVLIFLALTADSMVERQRLEIAILKSRGASSSQIAATYILQGLTLAILALALGLPLGWLAAQAIGSTRQFLTFQAGMPLAVTITRASVRFAGMAVLLALAATLAPAWRAAHLTIVVARQAISRPQTSPWLQQIAIDLLFLGAAGYGYYLLRGQGRIAQLQFGKGVDPWENPLLFLAPALFLAAGARLYLHAAPPALWLLGEALARTPATAALLAARNLARHFHRYSVLIALLVLTTGLGVFTASVARTLDDNLAAKAYYEVGADVAVVEAVGQISRGSASGMGQAASSQAAATEEEMGLPGWAMLPVTEHLKAPGVRAAARVGRFKVVTTAGGQSVEGYLYGVDRIDFPQVAYFRSDFAPQSLGALMNALAVEPSGILVRREFLARAGLRVGDPLALTGLIAGSNQPLLFKIVGTLDLFPTAYPGQGEFFVANLEYIFTELGGPAPYYVWLAVDQTLDAASVSAAIEGVGFRVLELSDARQRIGQAQGRPERIGLFGFLSLGFAVTTLLSMLALGTHAFLLYRQRFIQLGIMRAIGLSARQVAATLAGEQMLATLLSIIGGGAMGLLTSHLFIPFMQIGRAETDLVPPYLIIIDWQSAAYLVLALGAAALAITAGVIWTLSRLRLFQAIKLGETVG